eukprot:309348-Pyramimonas_sp.AAC.1
MRSETVTERNVHEAATPVRGRGNAARVRFRARRRVICASRAGSLADPRLRSEQSRDLAERVVFARRARSRSSKFEVRLTAFSNSRRFRARDPLLTPS